MSLVTLTVACRDAFAGGFIAGIVEGKSLDESIDMGHWLASLSIKELGPSYVINSLSDNLKTYSQAINEQILDFPFSKQSETYLIPFFISLVIRGNQLLLSLTDNDPTQIPLPEANIPEDFKSMISKRSIAARRPGFNN